MTKSALVLAAGFIGVVYSSSAQDECHPEVIAPSFAALSQPGSSLRANPDSAIRSRNIILVNAYDNLPSLTLADRGLFFFPRTFGWIEAEQPDLLPAFSAQQSFRVASRSEPSRNVGDKALDLIPRFDYAGGEVGVFYGKSTGKFDREVKQGYILGEVIDGNTHITVGASYQESNGHLPRR